jgi:PAS domain S-box-containing protein
MKRNTKKGQVLQTIKEVRKTGIDIIGDVPWGTHFCQFYQTKEDLLDILVPYFKAGLENNEFCMWVTSEPLGEEEAKKAMRKAVPDFDQHLKRGQIEIVPHTEWYLKDGAFNLQRVLDAWVDKLTFTLTKGYDGMRVTGNTAWLEKRDWRNFADYEEETDNAIGNYRMMAICSYSLDKCGASEVIDVVKNHKFALIKRQGEWALIESSERKRAEKETVQHTKNIEILSKAAIGFIELPAGGDIYRFIGVQLRELIENAVYILVNSFDQITRAIQARSLLADDQDMLAVSKTLGTDPMGMSFAVSEEAWNGLISGKLVRVPGGIHELSFGKIPKAACDALEKLAGTGDIFVMGFSKTEELYGSATIIMRKGCELKNRDAVEAFMHQTGVALQRKRAEEALRQSEERYRSLFDRSLECVYINDFEGNFLDANPKTLELLGYQKEDILALNFKSLLTEDQIPIVMEVLKKIIETGSQKRLTEYRLKAKDGGFVYVETQASIIYHEGKPYAVLGIARDITERKRAEEEVSRQKTLLQTIFDNIPAMIAFYDPNGQIEMVNRALEKTLGWSSEEISEIGLLEKCYPDPHYREEVLKYMINAEPGWRDFRTTTKNHRTIDTTWSNVKCPDGFSIGIGQDITERKKAEQALRDSEEKHRTYVENAPDGIFITDSNGRYIDANRAACRMTGYSRDELLNMRIMDLALPDASPEAFESFEKLKANGLMHSEITIQRKDGSRMWASLFRYHRAQAG